MDASAIADALSAWAEEGVDHVQVRCYPGNRETFEVALAGIQRFTG